MEENEDLVTAIMEGQLDRFVWINRFPKRESILSPTRTETSAIQNEDGSISFLLSQGIWTTVDAEDFEWLKGHDWSARKNVTGKFYGSRKGKISTGEFLFMSLHRVILIPIENEETRRLLVDHRDRDPMNNRRSNLRLCSWNQNSQNRTKRRNCTSTYKGVHLHSKTKRLCWRSSFCLDGDIKFLGLFETEIEAALAYDEAAKTHYGEFAALNFPEI
jgi:hypothetical protein